MDTSKFLFESEHTGRHIIVSMRTGKRYFIEPIDGKNKVKWGDLNPATGQIEGKYGSKYKGAVRRDESLITEENGFININELRPGISPAAYVEQLDAKYPDKD